MTSVSGISSAAQTDQTEFAKKANQGKKDFQALQDALEAGDLESAKSAFETLKKNKPSGPPPGPPPGESGSSGGQGGSDRESDFAALEKALSSGDVSAAKTAFETIQNRMKQGADGGGTSAFATASRSVSTDGVGSLLDLVA